eukprot:TRINITY_DN114734_c0_g1_i1.p1 TRINITY_DN114734_c0_g1~~TRINITY_DN114734_c0_g1_i1.p1  ORF type:complete len:462 (-),score=80.23 TRINITY_DN114734_c0_g1_i1:355-1740(-)
MDESAVCWWFLVMIIIWQYATERPRVYHCLKNALGRGKILTSWMFYLFVGIGLFLVRTMQDIVVFDYLRGHMLAAEQLWPDTAGITEEELAGHETPEGDREHIFTHGTRIISLMSPIAGSAAFVICLVHVVRIVGRETNRNAFHISDDARELRQTIINTLAMPAIYAVMSMRATIRIWAVMTGSGWLGRGHICADPTDCKWSEVKLLEKATYQTDLGIANAFQFFAVFHFGNLCRKFVVQSSYIRVERFNNEELRSYQRWTGVAALQGIYFYCVFGMLRSMILVFSAAGTEYPQYRVNAEKIQEMFIDKTDSINAFVTLAGVFNMLVISQLTIVKKRLGSLNMKFNATRGLLLLSQVQLAVLKAFTKDSPMHDKLELKVDAYPWAKYLLRVFTWNTHQAELMHSSLLCFECLLVVLFNFIAWDPAECARMFEHVANTDTTPDEVAQAREGKAEPLLQAEAA